MRRASLSATPKWRPSTSKATRSIPSGITPSSPVPAKHQVEVLISRRRLTTQKVAVTYPGRGSGFRAFALRAYAGGTRLTRHVDAHPKVRCVTAQKPVSRAETYAIER